MEVEEHRGKTELSLGTLIAQLALEEREHWHLITEAFTINGLAIFAVASRRQRNIWRACLVASEGTVPAKRLLDLSRDLLREAYPTYPEAFPEVVEKVEPDVPTWAWSVLCNIMRTDQRTARILTRCPKIDRSDLEALISLPKSCRYLVAQVMSLGGDPQRCTNVLSSLCTDGADPGIGLLKLRPGTKDDPWPVQNSKLVNELIFTSQFPAPPLKPMQNFRPIRSAEMLKVVSEAYRNCAYEYIGAIADGSSYIYEYTGKVSVLLRLNTEREDFRILEMQTRIPVSRSYSNRIAFQMVARAAAKGHAIGWGEARSSKIQHTRSMGAGIA